MTAAVSFTVHGTPAPQGSKTVGRTKAGAAFVREDNPQTEPWRNAVAAAATAAMLDLGEDHPLGSPLRLDVTFVFPRPRSHYRTGRNAGQLKPSAPLYHDRRPDLDKLVRAVGDALTGIVAADDAAFVQVVARKHYGQPAAHISVELLG